MKRIPIALLTLILASTPALAGVIGMVTATQSNQVTLTAGFEDGRPYLAVIQTQRNCPISFSPGTPFLGELMPKDRDGKPFVLLSIWDDEPQMKKCERTDEKAPSVKVFPLLELFAALVRSVGTPPPAKSGAKPPSFVDAFFLQGAPLVIELQEVPPGEYDTRVRHAVIKFPELTDEPKVVFQSQLLEPKVR